MLDASVLGAPDSRVTPHLAAYPPDLFDLAVFRSSELLDRYALAWALELLEALGLVAPLAEGTGTTLATLGVRLGFVPAFSPALAWLLDRLVLHGAVERETGADGATRYHLAAEAPTVAEGWGERPALRELGLALDPGNAATLDLLDAAGAVYPAAARGETTGDDALLGPSHIGLWLRYFENGNRVYGVANRVAAQIAVRRLPARVDRGLGLLEVGAGAGSASFALLAELDRQGRRGEVGEYVISEPGQFFRRRAERALRASPAAANLALRFCSLDIDQSWASQGIAAASADLIFGVNVLHVARHLDRSLAEAFAALVPGGVLVAGECLRPRPGQPVFAEMVFRLFAGFNDVETHPELRPTAGFLTPEQWSAALTAAGFVDIETAPDVAKIREINPLFSVGAMCGRRPA